MSIGLMDADIAKYHLVPFNLEIMKLSAYYKRRGEIVILAPSFEPERNKEFIYRKDYNDGDFPKDLTSYDNVSYGGLAFTNNHYQPLPLDIEIMKPDPTIYSRFMKQILGGAPSKSKEKIFKNMMDAEHCRISLDGQTVWSDYMRQIKSLGDAHNLIFHDYNLAAIDGSYDVVQSLVKKARSGGAPTRIGMKFPVQVSQGADLLKWSTLHPNSTFFSLQYNGVIDDDSFLEFIHACHEQSIYKQLDYYVTMSSSSENDFIKNHLREIFRQVIISRSYRVFFSLKYEDGFFFDKRWERVLDLFNFFENSLAGQDIAYHAKRIGTDTLFDFAKRLKEYPPSYLPYSIRRSEARELFEFVREQAPELFQDFYECNFNSLGEKV